MPVLHLIVGPHGAGKTSLYEYLLAPRHPGLPFVDAQAWIAAPRQALLDADARAVAARLWADNERQRLLREQRSFITETAFSHRSRVALIAQARSLGYEVVLYALALDEPRKLLQRVAQRVREGGAPIASHKVLERYSRCLGNLRQAIPFADMAMLIDAVDAVDDGPRLVATAGFGRVTFHSLQRPSWIEKVLGEDGEFVQG